MAETKISEASAAKDTAEAAEHKFSKAALVKSQRYQKYQDALSVLLEDGRMYTHNEVTAILNKFLKGKVK